jgi:hypothetical protein
MKVGFSPWFIVTLSLMLHSLSWAFAQPQALSRPSCIRGGRGAPTVPSCLRQNFPLLVCLRRLTPVGSRKHACDSHVLLWRA